MDTDNYWAVYYEKLDDDDFVLFRYEALDYCERLSRDVVLRPDSHVLDFGCGFGFVAENLSGRVGRLHLWDAAVNMLGRAIQRTRQRSNVSVLDLSGRMPMPRQHFDLILVNSVIQYMQLDELRAWLARWRSMLRPGGSVVLSDVTPLQASFVSQLDQTLAFSLKHGFLLSTLGSATKALVRYATVRHASTLLCLSREQLIEIGRAAGYKVELLPENLTYRRDRISALMHVDDS